MHSISISDRQRDRTDGKGSDHENEAGTEYGLAPILPPEDDPNGLASVAVAACKDTVVGCLLEMSHDEMLCQDDRIELGGERVEEGEAARLGRARERGDEGDVGRLLAILGGHQRAMRATQSKRRDRAVRLTGRACLSLMRSIERLAFVSCPHSAAIIRQIS